jgi:hypothetical protein
MAALLATRRKHSAASCGLHARTETVRFGAPALARLISALWQSNPPLGYARRECEVSPTRFACLDTRRPHQAAVHKPHLRPSANQLV